MKALFRLLRLLALPVVAVLPQAATAQSAPVPAFDFEGVAAIARERAARPHRPDAAPLPPELGALDYDAYRDIRFRPDRALWREAQLPFETQFFHRGLYQREQVRVHELHEGQARPVPYASGDYDFGRNALQPQSWADLGHAGLRIHYPLNTPQYKDELVVFLGASYFRALGQGQQYGLSARGLAIDTVGGSGEEFPRFTDFWLQRPAPDARQVTLYALLESPRATGAYRFDIVPGEQTVTRVQARIFLRAPVARLGIAPLTSMFLSGENQPRPGDFRPEVHDSDGLMVAAGNGEWLWRPLQNPRRTSVNSFAVQQLRGFGLMQRDRAFASYEDTEARYERRPSAWVRPLSDWGPGRVELLQLATPDETHDNIAAYWVPDRVPAPGEPLDLAYEIAWQGDAQQQPPGSRVVQSRRGVGYTRLTPLELSAQVQYVLDFEGPALAALPPGAPVRAVASADDNGRVLEAIAYPHPAGQRWRLTLRVQRLDPSRPVELRAFLQHDTHILSETWSNIILPE
ncbi:glucan biosynthesis protein G [Ramlibacter pallidus]|uniref:Glucans biosynthesis protein G n=1 Tax=Ramlibacter pallidus TaxID=2780087 RepID=A0ABR9S165_9BURK|nr:glucan biosynthesis protein G [Ramlibacter pallidus]MBE7367243.1 glucan biosynthesis protein G [Ramlibacter pallidus]